LPTSIIEAKDADGIIKAGQVIEAVIEMTALKSSTSAGVSQNSLVFMTSGEGVQGTANSGVRGPVDLVFTRFIFIKGKGGEAAPALTKKDDIILSSLTGGGTINNNSMAKIEAAPEGYVVRLFIKNNSGESRAGWNSIGTFGGDNITGLPGETFEVDIPVRNIKNNTSSIFGNCVFVKAELWGN
jgi:hypothetical protein